MERRTDVFPQLAGQGAKITALTADHRAAGPGTAYFAWPGEREDGRRHIPAALGRGAEAVIWETEGFRWQEDWQRPNVGVRGLRAQAGPLAHRFHGEPSAAMWTCGVTGTNGKTTCTQWLAAALDRPGERCAVLGTLGAGFPDALAPLANTTPGALDLHARLRMLREQGARAVAMEVSSHALAQQRTDGVAFACALFTNLSRDHLDYHGSMEAYFEAKARLFVTPGLPAAVLNLDDVFGVRLARRLASNGVRTIGYSLDPAAIAPGSVNEWIAARLLGFDDAGSEIEIVMRGASARARVPLPGRYSVANALGVLGCLIARGLPLTEAAARLAALPPVPGRLERLGGNGAPAVYVDYAHTPDALEKVLAALRPIAAQRGGALIAVFGAGGERDPGKRPLMGEAASRFADRVIVTSDNPRGEDAGAIAAAIRAGVSAPCEVTLDRAQAIRDAVAGAAAADVVLVAGKGHETWQETADGRRPFSDADEVRAALAARTPR